MRCLLFGFSAIYVLISFSSFGSSLENPTYNHENTVFGIQVKSEENAEISITKILEQGSLACGSEKCNCSVEILRHAKINPEKEKLTPEDLEDISALFIHKLLYSKSICDISKHECWNFESCFKEIIPKADIADVKSSLTSILTRLNMVLTTSSNDECHSASSIFEELKNANQSEGSNVEQMRRLFTIVVTHIIKGHCFYIEGATTDFLDDIFSMYGDRCSTVIKMDGLERLMNDLQDKNHNHNHDHEHNSDDNHNHSDTEHHHRDTEHHHRDTEHHHHHHADEADCEHSQHHANHLHNHSDENHEHQNYFAAQNNNGYKYNSHNHDHDHDHEHNHDHNHEHDHDHNHEHNHDHNHEHDHDHNHEHDHDHNHDHNHEHDLNRNHEHNHDHNHDYNERQIHAHGYYDREREDGNTNEHFMNQNFQNLTNVDNHESSTSMPESIVFNNYDQNEFKNITNQKLKHHVNNPNDDDHNGEHSSDKKNYRAEFNRKNDSELSSLDSNRNAYNNSANKLDLQKHHESKISTNKSDETNINNSSLVQNEENNPSFSTVEHNINEHVRTIENEHKGTEMLEQVEKHKTGEDSEENKTGDDNAQDFQIHTSPTTNSSINMDLDASLLFRNITDDDFKNMGTITSNVSHNSSSNLRLPDDHHMTSSSLESKQLVHHEDNDNKNDTRLTQHYTTAPVNFTKERRKPFTKQIENLQNLHAAASRVNLASKCLSTEELMNMFGTSSNTSLTRTEFLMICPALIQQLVTGVCQKSVARRKAIPSVGEVYGYSILSVFLISLTSLAGVVLLPILKKNVYHYIMAGCIGLAFSTLAGDALFHLIPQALNIHSHSHDKPAHDHKVDFQDPNLAKLVGIFLAIYALYIFEAVICTFSKTERHSHCPSKNGNGPRLADTKELKLISVKVQSESRSHLALSPQESASSLNTEIAENEITEKSDATMLNFPKICGLSTLALLVTLGDSIHNFGDGLAIGAAFSSGISSGLSTSIAVFCHELPHEFGDFVILLSSGLSFSKALWINFLSGLTCFIGLLIGLQIGVNEDARMWVIAVTAGIFLYVALAEMLPELRENKIGNPVKMLLAKNFGILAGMMMMITISVYEHHFII